MSKRSSVLLVAAFVAVSSTSAVSASAAPSIALKGLQPATYLQRRDRQPDLSAELATLSVDDRLRAATDDDAIAFAADSAYPAALKDEQRAQIRRRERQAVKLGALRSLVDSADARVDAAFVAALDDSDDVVAQRAAERFGDRASALVVPTLAKLAASDRSIDVRSGALAGLGRQRSAAALAALLTTTTTTTSTALQTAGLHAIELLGSRWAFAARREEALGASLRAEAATALAQVKFSGAAEVRRQAVVQRLR